MFSKWIQFQRVAVPCGLSDVCDEPTVDSDDEEPLKGYSFDSVCPLIGVNRFDNFMFMIVVTLMVNNKLAT